MVEINITEYLNDYNNIIDDLNKDNEILPFLLDRIPVDDTEYDKSIGFEVDYNILVSKYSNRRKDELEIYSKYDYSKPQDIIKCHEEINQYHQQELINFINKYPQYAKVIE